MSKNVTPDDDVTLLPELQELARDFVVTKGRLRMPERALRRWTSRLKDASPEMKDDVSLQLLALALKYREIALDLAAPAIEQLIELALALLDGSARTAARRLARAEDVGAAFRKSLESVLATRKPNRLHVEPSGGAHVQSQEQRTA